MKTIHGLYNYSITYGYNAVSCLLQVLQLSAHQNNRLTLFVLCFRTCEQKIIILLLLCTRDSVGRYTYRMTIVSFVTNWLLFPGAVVQ